MDLGLPNTLHCRSCASGRVHITKARMSEDTLWFHSLRRTETHKTSFCRSHLRYILFFILLFPIQLRFWWLWSVIWNIEMASEATSSDELLNFIIRDAISATPCRRHEHVVDASFALEDCMKPPQQYDDSIQGICLKMNLNRIQQCKGRRRGRENPELARTGEKQRPCWFCWANS